jgi:colicin import membrane protein
MMRTCTLLSLIVSLTAGAMAQAPEPISHAEAAHIQSIITSCLRKHWRVPSTGQPVRVTLGWQLDRDGKLVGGPKIVGQEITPEIMPSAKRAIQAVRACSPFKLPAARYNVWKTIIWEFDPTRMPN